MKRARKGRMLSMALMLTGFGWISYLLVDSAGQVPSLIPENPFWFIGASLFIALSLSLNAMLLYVFLLGGIRTGLPFGAIMRLHFTTQLLRYLPGRFWGLIYQANALGGMISKTRIIRANIDFMLFSTISSGLISILILGHQSHITFWTLTLIFGLGEFLIAYLFLRGANDLLRLTSTLLPGKFRAILVQLSYAPLTATQLFKISVVFFTSWVLYVRGWQMLGQAYITLSAIDLISICAIYTLASILGIISAITPAGLGVREATFFALAINLASPEILTFIAALGRIWVMGLEVMLGAISLICFKCTRTK